MGVKFHFFTLMGPLPLKLTPKVAAISGQNNGSVLKLTTLNAGYTRVRSLAKSRVPDMKSGDYNRSRHPSIRVKLATHTRKY